MTRQEITNWIVNRLGETDGAAGSRNPFGYDDDINQAANEIAVATDCFYAAEVMDIAARQSDYCAPPIYKVVGVTVYDSLGCPHGLTELTPWQTFPADGYSNGFQAAAVPQAYIALGANLVRLVPAPSYNSSGITISDLTVGANPFQVSSASAPFVPGSTGFLQVMDVFPDGLMSGPAIVQAGNLTLGVFTPVGAGIPVVLSLGAGTPGVFLPGRYKILGVDRAGNATLDRSPGPAYASGGTAEITSGGVSVEGYAIPGNTWPLPSDVCPLPLQGHVAVAARAAWMRCMNFPSAENMARMPMLDQVYKYAKGQLEGAVARQTDAAAARDGQSLYFGAFTNPTDIGNPLEL